MTMLKTSMEDQNNSSKGQRHFVNY